MKNHLLQFVFVLCFTRVASAAVCEAQLPAGFDVQEVLFSLTVEHYDYYVHVEFPDLKKACWNNADHGSLQGSLPGGKIIIRASTIDGTQQNILDQIPTENLMIDPQNDPRFLGLTTGFSIKDKTQFIIFYSDQMKTYITIQNNLQLMPGSKINRAQVILR